MKLESDFSFISNCGGDFDDIILVQLVSNEFTNGPSTISIWLYTDHLPTFPIRSGPAASTL